MCSIVLFLELGETGFITTFYDWGNEESWNSSDLPQTVTIVSSCWHGMRGSYCCPVLPHWMAGSLRYPYRQGCPLRVWRCCLFQSHGLWTLHLQEVSAGLSEQKLWLVLWAQPHAHAGLDKSIPWLSPALSAATREHWHLQGHIVWLPISRNLIWWDFRYSIVLRFFLKDFFLMWTIFKGFIEFVTILLLFYVLVFWPRGTWDLSSPTRDQTLTPLCWKA